MRIAAPSPRRLTPAWAVGSWSSSAAWRALRAAVIVPAVLAIAFKVVGDVQMAAYAAFGGFANLVLASFSGSRRDRLVAHLGLGLAGSGLLVIGTAIHSSTALAASVTLIVTFIVLLAGVTGPNAAAGGVAAMLVYVLAAASPGAMSMIPSRLAGWWLATAAATVAVVAMSPRQAADPLVEHVAATARALAQEAAAVASGSVDQGLRAASVGAQEGLQAMFNAAPYRPTHLAAADQALGSMVGLLAWVSALVGDTVADADQLGDLSPVDSEVLVAVAAVLDDVGGMLLGGDATPDLDRLEGLRVRSAGSLRHLGGGGPAYRAAVHASFHTRTIAVAVRSVATEALVATGRSSRQSADSQRLAWASAPASRSAGELLAAASRPSTPGPAGAVADAAAIIARHASIRSVWVRNSARGAVAVGAAVTVADLTNVQHGFWVVLGALSVLRATATATGSTAVRAVGGTALGFLAGAALVLAVGTDTTVLWAVLPVAVLVAAYTPGVAPFAAGQAAFTVTLVVLYNLLDPVGWKIGEIRLEDVAIGCAISVIAGALCWPRGATSVVVDDLHDALVSAAAYLVQAAEWALGLRDHVPDAGRSAMIAGFRLDDAVRAFLTEQGFKALPKEDLWQLVGGAQRLRLTAAALAELPPPPAPDPTGEMLRDRARALSDWYATVASHMQRGQPPRLLALDLAAHRDPEITASGHRGACHAYVAEHLRHPHIHHRDLIRPATQLSEARRQPWWRPAPIPLPIVPAIS